MLNDSNNFVCLLSPERYYDFSACQFVPSHYICLRWDRAEVETTEKEIADYAAKSPAFAFLSDPEEDIYNCNDGKPL
jgi:hypothetical protein